MRRIFKELYLATGRQEEYKQQLWNLVMKDHPGDVGEFKELKKVYTEEEWETVREEIFAQLSPYGRVERLY